MKEVLDIFEDYDDIYFYYKQDGRGCYYSVERSELNPYLPDDKMCTDDDLSKAVEKWAFKNVDISQLPHIEDATPAMRLLYKRISSSENNMFFVDEDTEDWQEQFGMSREEFEKQVDADVEKFNLENVVVKYGDDNILYSCYGNLQNSFTEKTEPLEETKLNMKDQIVLELPEKPNLKDFIKSIGEVLNEYEQRGIAKKNLTQTLTKIFADKIKKANGR